MRESYHKNKFETEAKQILKDDWEDAKGQNVPVSNVYASEINRLTPATVTPIPAQFKQTSSVFVNPANKKETIPIVREV